MGIADRPGSIEDFSNKIAFVGEVMNQLRGEIEHAAVLLSAVELGVLRLNEDAPKVLPYSTEKVI